MSALSFDVGPVGEAARVLHGKHQVRLSDTSSIVSKSSLQAFLRAPQGARSSASKTIVQV
ncbi:hypothetical protein CERZMDRAFT_90328 [Cercospora zeae-maydis SCOH1-5]|uniref:Uncharacterized protein n=1 Tax=Cercospora zeae-maydis SCOH1-5 TaxID=717836 RepID=A0A6A6FLY1_9PEZI|nr:hypothetical protein CERZMDRAFT_90328 [Cercospora zeae-maydis SCOH1-5]